LDCRGSISGIKKPGGGLKKRTHNGRERDTGYRSSLTSFTSEQRTSYTMTKGHGGRFNKAQDRAGQKHVRVEEGGNRLKKKGRSPYLREPIQEKDVEKGETEGQRKKNPPG